MIKYICPTTGHEIPKTCCANCVYDPDCQPPSDWLETSNVASKWGSEWDSEEDYCSKFKLNKENEGETRRN